MLLNICTVQLETTSLCRFLSVSIFKITQYVCTNITVSDLYSGAHPVGSCYTLQNCIGQHASNRINIRNVDDVITYFDNNQVLARHWLVEYDAKAILSYITTIVHFFPKHIIRLYQIFARKFHRKHIKDSFPTAAPRTIMIRRRYIHPVKESKENQIK